MKFELEIVKFNAADVITTSPAPCNDDNMGECDFG